MQAQFMAKLTEIQGSGTMSLQIDFKSAFPSLSMDVFLKVMEHRGVHEDCINLIRRPLDNSITELHPEGGGKPYEIRSSVQQK